MNEFLLKAEQINVEIEGVPILRQVDFTLRAGEFVGLIGANGAGKSTLLKVLGGLWREDMSGAVLACGRRLRSYSARELARMIAYVPQSTRVDFAFTAREVTLMGRNPHVGRFQMESARDRAITDEALVTADADHLAEREVATLSGGEGQRVVIARALAQQARIMLLDEPTTNLDVRHQLDLLTLAREQAHTYGLGVVAAVHDLGMAARFCDRLALLHEGGVIADGEPEAVLTPERLRTAFEIDGRLYRDPFTDALTLSVG